MTDCIYKPCLRCTPSCLPIDTPEAHAEHARIVDGFSRDRGEYTPLRDKSGPLPSPREQLGIAPPMGLSQEKS